MLPQGNLNGLFYPMTADIYYATKSQNDFGELQRSWTMDRSINCSAIKENPQSQMRTQLTSEKFLEYDVKINMRTNENIYKSLDGTHYRPTDILVRNIKDPFGSIAWTETDTEPTNFEIDTIEPMFDAVHNIMGYRILLRRSDLQVAL
jgi:hypothetical protein